MSDLSGQPQPGGGTLWQRRLAPRPQQERARAHKQWLTESIVLICVGILLAVATINDLVRQSHINERFNADLHTWRVKTGHNYHNVSTQQDLKHHSTRDVACGNISPGTPGERAQVCLIMTGPVHANLRSSNGGYYLPAHRQDLYRYRYGCFGSAKIAGLCKTNQSQAAAQSIKAAGGD